MSAATAPLLNVNQLNAWYGRAQILFDISFLVEPGEAVVLLGRNGAGKSTTMKTLMRLVPDQTGTVTFEGEQIDTMPTYRIARRGVGYVPEDRRIFTGLTVMENLTVGTLPARDGDGWTPDELFELFPNLGRMRDRPGGRMSGGEQQMLTIARTLMGNPKCVLLDEPSEGLAPVIVDAIAERPDLKKRGMALVLSEQSAFRPQRGRPCLRYRTRACALRRQHRRARRQRGGPGAISFSMSSEA